MPTANRDEYLTIGAVIIGTAACHATNLQELYSQAHRGEDRIVPGSAGVVAYPRRLDAIRFRIELIINGRYTSDGALNADPDVGVRANIAELKTVTAPVTTGDGTRTVTWTRPGGSVTADCHVGPLLIGRHVGPAVFSTLELNVPAGEFS